jgi:cell wall assembly regulator SMI1
VTVTIVARVTPECAHEECYSGTCHGLTDVEVTAEVDLAAETVSNVRCHDGDREVSVSDDELLQLYESLFDEAERIDSLCPRCEAGATGNDVCAECRDAEEQLDQSSFERAHGPGSF